MVGRLVSSLLGWPIFRAMLVSGIHTVFNFIYIYIYRYLCLANVHDKCRWVFPGCPDERFSLKGCVPKALGKLRWKIIITILRRDLK